MIATSGLYLDHAHFREANTISYIIHEHVKMTGRSTFYFNKGSGPAVWSPSPALEHFHCTRELICGL